MNKNLKKLIDNSIFLSKKFDLIFMLRYLKEKEIVRFKFIKNDKHIILDFSLLEINCINDINILCEKLNNKVFELISIN